jgi:hypothetical protein
MSVPKGKAKSTGPAKSTAGNGAARPAPGFIRSETVLDDGSIYVWDTPTAPADDREIYSMAGSTFRQAPNALHTWAPPKTEDGEPKQYEILTGHLSVTGALQLHDLDPDRHPETTLTDTVFDVTYRPRGQDNAHDEQSGEVSAIDQHSREPAWPDALGVRPRALKRHMSKISDAVTVMAHDLETRQGWGHGYACAGPIRLPDGGLAFLRPGAPALTADGTDPALTCRFPAGVGTQPGVRVLTIDDPSTPETADSDLDAYLRILDLTPGQPEIALCLACLLAWAPFASLPGMGMAAAVLAGETGSLKTAMGGVLIAAQSRTFTGGQGVEVPVTAKMRGNQTTVFGADQIMHPLSGFLALADDLFADQMTPREVAEAWRRLSLIGDNVATGSGGTRGGYRNGRRDLPPPVYPRCCLLVTAERLPDESAHSSATARFAVLELGTPVNRPVLTELQAKSREISRAHAAMIASRLAAPAALQAARAAGKDITRGWGLEGHGRVEVGYEHLAAGAYLIGERIRAVANADPALWLADAADLLRKAASDQTQRSGMRKGRDMARDPIRLFAKHLRAVLAGNPCWLASDRNPTADGSFHPPTEIPGHGPQSVGWRQTGGQLGGMIPPGGGGPPVGAVIVSGPRSSGWPRGKTVARIRAADWPGIHDAVAERVGRDGWSLPEPDVMRARLADAGYLQSAADSQSLLWAKNTRCLALDLGRILDGAEDGPDLEPEPDATEDQPDNPGPAQEALDGLPGPDDGPAHGSQADPNPEQPGAAKPCPGPCRGCGETWEYGRGGWLCPACQAKASAPAEHTEPAPDRPTAKRRGHASGYAVLSPAGLHLPGQDPRPCPLPPSLADAYALAAEIDANQLWIHPVAAVAMGLPGLDARRNVPIDAGSPHPWATLVAGLRDAEPAGLAPWMTVWDTAGGRQGTGRSIVLPHLESRAAWAFDQDGEPWGPEFDGPALLEAVTLLSAALGSPFDYYRSPNATAAQMARRLCRNLSPCEAIRTGRVPPALSHSLMLPAAWSRPLTAAERADTAVIKLDRNAAYLSAMNTPLGIGEPERRTGPVDFDPKLAGYYRLASQPRAYDPLLPPLEIMPRGDGALWVARPDAELLAGLGILPEIAEAWIWPQSGRVLAALYNRLRKARETLLPAKATPAGRAAWMTLGILYKSFVGYLARTAGPRNADDILWRPDYRDHIEAEAYGRMFRNLIKARDASGRHPIAAHVDAVYFTTSQPTPVKARPAGLTYGTGGGAWKDEGYAPLAALDLSHIQASFREVTGE